MTLIVKGLPNYNLTRRELQEQVEKTQRALSQLSSSVIADLTTLQGHLQATRELVADLSARLDRAEAQTRDA